MTQPLPSLAAFERHVANRQIDEAVNDALAILRSIDESMGTLNGLDFGVPFQESSQKDLHVRFATRFVAAFGDLLTLPNVQIGAAAVELLFIYHRWSDMMFAISGFQSSAHLLSRLGDPETGNWKLSGGRKFEDDEQKAGAAVCIVGETVRRELYGGTAGLTGLGEQLRIKQFSCTVIGILASKGQAAMRNDQDDTVLVPLHTLQRRVTGSVKLPTLLVAMEAGSDSAPLKASLRQLLRERRKLADSDDDNFNILDTQQLADALSGTTRVLTTLLGAVAAVSLLVGGIGIMNIMLVSVTERTREIGLRLAVGALESEVLLQFLIEAVTLSALGGLVGILIATAASWALALAMGVPFVFDPSINLLSLAFSALIGVVFGYFPARRAARMDPIEALRHE